MSKTTKTTVFFSTLLALMVGCGPQDAQGPNEQDDQLVRSKEAKLLAKVELSDGSEIEFLELMPGELFIGIMADKEKLETLTALQDGKDAVAFFEALSGKEAPAELVALQQRVSAAELQKAPSDKNELQSLNGYVEGPRAESDDFTSDGIGRKQNALTGQQFQNLFCRPDDISYCWTDVGGYSAVWQWGKTMHSTVCAELDNVVQRLEIVNNIFSTSVMQRTVYQGSCYYMGTSGWFKERRAHAWGGRRYHHFAHARIW